MLNRSGKGRYLEGKEAQVFLPIITAFILPTSEVEVVCVLKYSISLDKRHGNLPLKKREEEETEGLNEWREKIWRGDLHQSTKNTPFKPIPSFSVQATTIENDFIVATADVEWLRCFEPRIAVRKIRQPPSSPSPSIKLAECVFFFYLTLTALAFVCFESRSFLSLPFFF
jgi:hypothetical protein